MGPFDASWLASAMILTAPLLFAAIGELFSEQAGVLNIGLEGMMLMGAFWGFWADWYFENIWIGILGGIVGGAALALVMAVLSLTTRADQIVVGVGLNIFALGLTGYVFRQAFGGQSSFVLPRMEPLEIPLLADIPGVGRALFNHVPLLYLAFLGIPLAYFVLYRTTWGLSIRAVGETPAAADTAGVNVDSVRWRMLLVTGGLAGIGGAMLSVVQLGLFQQNMTAGRGYIALAAVIFGRWRPLGVLIACVVFGATDALQLRLQATGQIAREVWAVILIGGLIWLTFALTRPLRARVQTRQLNGWRIGLAVSLAIAGLILFAVDPEVSLPSQLWLSLPYVLTIVVLAGFAGESNQPKALTLPYIRALEA